MGATVFFQSSSEIATLSNSFSVGSVLTDPTTISLTVTTPTGTATVYTYAAAQITKTSTGVYTKDVTSNEAGTWTYQWDGTGTATDTQAGTWDVFDTALGHLYATVETLKSRLGLASTDTVDDFELHAACFAASRWIESYCDRVFYRSAASTVRTFEPTGLYTLRLPDHCDLVSVSALKTDTAGDGTFETTWAAGDYQLWPYNPAAGPEQRPYTRIQAVGANTYPTPTSWAARRDLIQITGVYGWPSVPMAVRQAALMLAEETFRMKDAPFGIQGFGDFAMRIRANPKVAAFVDPYRRNPILMA